MPRFSDKRFVDIGQTLYTSWIKDLTPGVENTTEEQQMKEFSFLAQLAFTAAGEFAKVFEGQEEHK